jgi:preprotein translocase subunit SecE
MEAVTSTRFGALQQWGERAVAFFRDVRGELRKVNWPSRDELVKATRMIVILTIVLGIAIGLLDLLLNLILVDGLARITR